MDTQIISTTPSGSPGAPWYAWKPDADGQYRDPNLEVIRHNPSQQLFNRLTVRNERCSRGVDYLQKFIGPQKDARPSRQRVNRFFSNICQQFDCLTFSGLQTFSQQ